MNLILNSSKIKKKNVQGTEPATLNLYLLLYKFLLHLDVVYMKHFKLFVCADTAILYISFHLIILYYEVRITCVIHIIIYKIHYIVFNLYGHITIWQRHISVFYMQQNRSIFVAASVKSVGHLILYASMLYVINVCKSKHNFCCAITRGKWWTGYLHSWYASWHWIPSCVWFIHHRRTLKTSSPTQETVTRPWFTTKQQRRFQTNKTIIHHF